MAFNKNRIDKINKIAEIFNFKKIVLQHLLNHLKWFNKKYDDIKVAAINFDTFRDSLNINLLLKINLNGKVNDGPSSSNYIERFRTIYSIFIENRSSINDKNERYWQVSYDKFGDKKVFLRKNGDLAMYFSNKAYFEIKLSEISKIMNEFNDFLYHKNFF